MKREKTTKYPRLLWKMFGNSRRSELENSSLNEEEFERCVMCGKLTCVPVSMPVDWRENYEMGMGQICAECAKNST